MQFYLWAIFVFFMGVLVPSHPMQTRLFFATVPLGLTLLIVCEVAARRKRIAYSKAWLFSFAVCALMLAVPYGWLFYKEYVENRYVVPTGEYREDLTAYMWSRADGELRDMDARGIPQNHPERQRLKDMGGAFREIEPVPLAVFPTFSISDNHPRIDGATSLVSLFRSFAHAIYRNAGELTDLVMCSRTPYAYENLLSGRVDMIFAFRPSEKQIAEAAEKGLILSITPIAYDAFIFFINAANPVDGLTRDQLRDIYSGKTVNWRQVGGESRSIDAFQRIEGSGSQSRMLAFMGETGLMRPTEENLYVLMREIVTAARYHNYGGAIGYSFLFFVDRMLLEKGVKLLAVDGVAPCPETIWSGAYPLREEICVVTAGSDNPHIQPFIDWMLSPQGQGLVKKVGYAPVKARL